MNFKKFVKKTQEAEREAESSLDKDFLNKYFPEQVRVTRYYMYQSIFKSINDLGLDMASGKGVSFGGESFVTELFPLIDWQITELKQGYDLRDTSNITEKYHIVVADQVLEHVTEPWKVPYQVSHILNDGGLCIVTCPFVFPYHNTFDGWRFSSDGLTHLFGEHFDRMFAGGWGNLRMLEYSMEFQEDWSRVFIGTKEFLADKELHIRNSFLDVVVWYCGKKACS